MKKLFALLMILSVLLSWGCAERDLPAVETSGSAAVQPDGGCAERDLPAVETEVVTEEPVELAPALNVYDREGNPVSLTDMIGKPVIINFWATWCGPCKSELPAFQQAYETYGEDVVFMMVDMVSGREETKAGAIEYVDGQGYTFPLYFDEDQTAVVSYNISAVPATFVIDAKGQVVQSHVGAMDFEQISALIESVL